jgi:hypothetical protein
MIDGYLLFEIQRLTNGASMYEFCPKYYTNILPKKNILFISALSPTAVPMRRMDRPVREKDQ